MQQQADWKTLEWAPEYQPDESRQVKLIVTEEEKKILAALDRGERFDFTQEVPTTDDTGK